MRLPRLWYSLPEYRITRIKGVRTTVFRVDIRCGIPVWRTIGRHVGHETWQPYEFDSLEEAREFRDDHRKDLLESSAPSVWEVVERD